MSDSPKQGSGDGAIDQSDIDALFGGGGSSDSPSGKTPEPTAPAGQVDQGDIDALLAATGSSQDEPAAESDATPPRKPDTRVDTLGRPFDEVAAAMQAALEEEGAAAPPPRATPPPPVTPAPPPPSSQPFDLPSFDDALPPDIDAKKVTMLNDVNLNVRIELGRTRMLVEDVLRLNEGSVVELDKLAGDPVDVFANERLVARGEVLVLNDSFCVRVSEVFSRDPHRVVH